MKRVLKAGRMKVPMNKNLKQALWTLAALLLTLIAASMAEAQTEAKFIDKAKCDDIDRLSAQLRDRVVTAAQAVQSKYPRVRPAIAYEMQKNQDRRQMMRTEPKLKQQASQLANALTEAIKKPQDAAAVASEVLNGSDQLKASGSRRASLQMYEECYNQQNRKVENSLLIDNNRYIPADRRCPSQSVVSTGINATQVFQTEMEPRGVKDAFTGSLINSDQKTHITLCTQPCTNPQASVPKGFPTPNTSLNAEPTDYRLRAEQNFADGLLAFMHLKMTNDTNLRVTPIPVCGARAYLVSVMSLPGPNGLPESEAGFDSSTLLGLIAPIGEKKTLILGSLSAQWMRKGSESPMPLIFRDIPDRVTKEVFEKYNSVSQLLKARERAVNGEIGGDSRIYPVQGFGTNRPQRAAQ